MERLPQLTVRSQEGGFADLLGQVVPTPRDADDLQALSSP
jgi:hypothetical protein